MEYHINLQENGRSNSNGLLVFPVLIVVVLLFLLSSSLSSCSSCSCSYCSCSSCCFPCSCSCCFSYFSSTNLIETSRTLVLFYLEIFKQNNNYTHSKCPHSASTYGTFAARLTTSSTSS